VDERAGTSYASRDVRYTRVYIGIGLAVLVAIPVAWVAYGIHYDRAHPTDTVGGPLTIGICIVMAIISDLVLLIVAAVIAVIAVGWQDVREAWKRRQATRA
jgi:uncharacterized membrane protein